MTPEEEQSIRERHQPEPLPEGRTDIYCIECDARLWPCDTAVVLAALDALRNVDTLLADESLERLSEARAELNAALRGGTSLASALAAERDAAIARAQELSARLDECGAYRVEAEDREKALADALRDAIDVAHETDSLRSHSDDERKDGWFRAPLYRCQDAICEAANAALRQQEEAT